VDELGIVEVLDELVPQDLSQRKVSIGMSVKAMILNGLGFANRQLYLLPQFFENKPIELLLGDGIKPEQLHDKTLGRALDALYEYGVTALFGLIAKEALQKLGVDPAYLHLDSTAFHVDGRYVDHNTEDAEPTVIQITQGYSKDHRPDLNQVMLNLICENSSGIPVAMKALSGNASDKVEFEKMISEHVSLIANTSSATVVADSALYTASSLSSMQELGIHWITRVPENIKEAKDAIAHSDPKNFEMHPEDERYTFVWCSSQYANIKHSWIIIHSKEARTRTLSTLNRKFDKLSRSEIDTLAKLSKEQFACEADALQAIQKIKKRLKLITFEASLLSIHYHPKKGRPAKDAVPSVKYQIVTNSQSCSLELYQKELKKGSCFILSSNNLDLKPVEIINAYKNQYLVERGFRFLKSPEFLADSFFLKKTAEDRSAFDGNDALSVSLQCFRV
jgi:transposase